MTVNKHILVTRNTTKKTRRGTKFDLRVSSRILCVPSCNYKLSARGSALAFVLIVCFSLPLHAQLRQARKEMDRFNYSLATAMLERTAGRQEPDVPAETALLLAECYRNQNDPVNAAIWYARAVGAGIPGPDICFHYARSLQSTGDYLKAKEYFLWYDSIHPGDPKGKLFAGFCDSALAWKNLPSFISISNTGSVNTSQSEFGLMPYGEIFIFVSDQSGKSQPDKIYGWTGNGYLQIFTTSIPTADSFCPRFQGVKDMQELNAQPYHNGPVSFRKNFGEAAINRTLLTGDKGRKDPGGFRTHLLKIFFVTREDDKWGKPDPFFLNSDEYSVGHPAFSAGGDTLYFVSDMPGGYGGTDIYLCRDQGTGWSAPVNLGPEINSAGNEMFPFVSQTGDLFFASDGHAGFGGLDIFISRKEHGTWKASFNPGLPLNSPADDFSLMTDSSGRSGFFSSDRSGGMGGDDIYCFRLTDSLPFFRPSSGPPEDIFPKETLPVYVTGCVKDKRTLDPVPGATVAVFNHPDSTLSVVTDSMGCFSAGFHPSHPSVFNAGKTGYLPDELSLQRDSVTGKTSYSLPRDLLLDKLEVNRIFVLENIYYDFDKWNIRGDAIPSLEFLIGVLQENPVSIELRSHTDCRGSDEYNRILSQKRAESAVNYITGRGIDPARITARGYGESELVNSCSCLPEISCTEPEHQANRRTEFKITGWTEIPEKGFGY